MHTTQQRQAPKTEDHAPASVLSPSHGVPHISKMDGMPGCVCGVGLVSEYANAGATPLPHLAATLEEYNTIAQAGKTDPFGKAHLPRKHGSGGFLLRLQNLEE
jgi:hypothetical protein